MEARAYTAQRISNSFWARAYAIAEFEQNNRKLKGKSRVIGVKKARIRQIIPWSFVPRQIFP
jgi:hypothetical protein